MSEAIASSTMPAEALRAFGRPIPRVDGPLKVAGRARFAAEAPFAGLVYASLAFSSIARGRIATLDTAGAEQAPGVVLVMTHLNAPRMPAPPLMMQDPIGAAASSLPVMQDATIRWNGQPIAVVIAETQDQADHAAGLVRATYVAEDAATDFHALMDRAKPPANIMGEPAEIAKGDAEAALAAAPHRVDQTYTSPRHNHCAIEPHAVTAAWEDGGLVMHDTTQLINLARGTLARVFGLAEDKVRVLSPFVGGGFGNKTFWDHHLLAAAAAKATGRPVRMALSREGVFRITGGRTPTQQRVALGAGAEGPLHALIHTGVAGMTDHNSCPEQFTFPAKHLYATRTMLLSQQIVELDMVANTFMRAPGESIGTFALESAIDELAEKMGVDPIALRIRLEPASDPASGLPFSSRHLVEAYQAGAERFGWAKRNPTPRSRREGEWWIGQGCATATYPYYRMPGGEARITLSADGSALVSMGAHEMGMGTATAQAQYAADRLGLSMGQVRFEYGDSALPTGTIAGGSSQSATIAATVTAAYEALLGKLLQMAGNDSPLGGLAVHEVEARNAGLCRKGDPQRAETYVSILARAGQSEVSANAPAPPPGEVQAFSMHSYGAQFAEVRVNAVTGETRVSRFLGSFDTGRIINPLLAASQFRGGIIMGLGLALTEETLFDPRTGRIMNPSLAEYHVPSHLDVPEIDVIWTDIPDPHSPQGLHGIGEIGITGVGAAVANAVYNAVGVRVRDLPITLDKVM